MKSREQSSEWSPLPAEGGERARYEANAVRVRGQALTTTETTTEDPKPTHPETLRHRHQIQARQTRARRVIHHRRIK